MFNTTAQASCRLTARRRLALGGLVMTGALTAGMLGSAPAFAAPGEVHTFAQLNAALTGSDAVVTLAADFDESDKSGLVPEAITSDKTLDLNGQQSINLDQTTVADGVEFDVVDSTSVDGSAGSGSLYFNADSSASASTPGVQLGAGSALHITGATVFSTGADGGAGIGATSANATFVADGGAVVTARGEDRTDANGDSDGGGAGIGGSADSPGFGVTIGDATVRASGGGGAAGIGGGSAGEGGSVHIQANANVTAEQGDTVGPAFHGASSIGAGQSAGHSGALHIDADAYFQVSVGSPLLLLPGADVVNNGSIYLDDSNAPGTAIDGSGTIENHGSITASTDDPTTLLGSHIAVTGFNYDVTVLPNGGTISGPTHAHLLSGSINALVSPYNGVTPPSDDTLFWKWTAQADGTGTAIAPTSSSTDDLTAFGTSDDGTAVPVQLYAQFGHPPVGTEDTLPDAVVGTAYNQALPVSGDGITSYQLAGPQSSSDSGSVLPAGLSIDSTTGRITGTPTAAFDGDVTFDVVGVGENLIRFHLAVGGAPVFATAGLPGGTVGDDYATRLAVGGDDNTSYSVVAGALPSGLRLGSNGYISGTPDAATSASFTVRATSRFGSTDRTFTIVIGAAAAQPSNPVLGAAPRASVKFGHQLTLAVTADSASPVTFKLIGGGLPKGVSLNAKTGVISGAPVESGTFTLRVRVSNKDGYSDAFVVITVAKQVDLITAKPVAPVAIGATVVPVKVAGFKKGEHWTVRVDGKIVAHGTIKKTGALSVSVHLKKASRDKVHTIVVSSSRKVTDPAKRAATVLTVTSLSAKKTLKLKSEVGQDGRKYVVIDRLAANEHVVVKDGSKVIASGRATADGIFVFPQAKAGKGTSKLTVHGASAKRSGKLTVKNPTH